MRPGLSSRPADGRDAPAPGPGLANPEHVVATVGGRPITTARLDRRIAELQRGARARHIPPDGMVGSEDVRWWVLQELVTEAVLVHEARAAGIPDDDPDATRLSPGAIGRLVAVVTAGVTIAEDELRTYYARNRDLYERPEVRRVRHAVIADEAAARQVAVDAAAGDDPAVLVDLREVRRGELTGPLEDAIFAADPGALVGPIRTGHGWHVARVETVTAASTIPFAEARPSIEAELLVAARARAFDEWLDGRRRALVRIAPELEHPGHPVHGVSSHRH
jgi:[acyl-carrier-protein] S-malonyltransferase